MLSDFGLFFPNVFVSLNIYLSFGLPHVDTISYFAKNKKISQQDCGLLLNTTQVDVKMLLQSSDKE